MAEQPVKCGDCPKLVTPQKTWSDRNGNQGRLYAMCKGTTEQPHPQWFRFVTELTPSPTLPSPNPYDQWIAPTESQQPAFPASTFPPTTCVVPGCDKRINQRCARHACAAHCRIQGGCPLAAHAPKNNEPAQALPATSQSSASSWGVGHVPIPPTQQDPSTRIGDANHAQMLSAGYGPPPPIPPRPIQPIASGSRPEPPASMNPLPNPRYASQIRPIFTEELAQKQELLRARQIQDAERLEAANRAKHEVTICAWLSDNEEPQSCIFQGDFIWPNFVLKASVLSDVGLVLGLDKPWFKVYNHARKLWERVRLNHVISVQGRPEILLKALDVDVCQDFSKFTTPPSTAAPHIRNDLKRERESVKQKGRKRFLEADAGSAPAPSRKRGSASLSCGSSTKRPRRQSHSPRSPSSHLTAPPRHSQRQVSLSHTSSSPPFHDNHQATSTKGSQSPISVSSSAAPSPARIPANILELTDSDSGPSFRTPVARHRRPVDVAPVAPSPPASIKQERSDVATRNTPRRTPRRRVTSTDTSTFSKRWPSDYHVVDVATVLEACTPPPPGMTIARVFESHVFQTFKPSTFYDTKDRWNVASQEDRDAFESYGYTEEGLWSGFASRVPMKNATMRAARQRQTRLACRIKTQREEADDISSQDDSDSSSSPSLSN